jgi:hypothetical protein
LYNPPLSDTVYLQDAPPPDPQTDEPNVPPPPPPIDKAMVPQPAPQSAASLPAPPPNDEPIDPQPNNRPNDPPPAPPPAAPIDKPNDPPPAPQPAAPIDKPNDPPPAPQLDGDDAPAVERDAVDSEVDEPAKLTHKRKRDEIETDIDLEREERLVELKKQKLLLERPDLFEAELLLTHRERDAKIKELEVSIKEREVAIKEREVRMDVEVKASEAMADIVTEFARRRARAE